MSPNKHKYSSKCGLTNISNLCKESKPMQKCTLHLCYHFDWCYNLQNEKKRVHLSSYIPADTSSKFTMVLFQNFHTLMDNTPSMLPPLPFALTDGGEIN